MTTPSQRKGSQWERDIRDHLRANGFPHAERIPAGATHDRGDITGIPGVVIEAKNAKRIELGPWLDEAVTEAANVSPTTIPLLVVKRRLHGVADAFAVMPFATAVEVLR